MSRTLLISIILLLSGLAVPPAGATHECLATFKIGSSPWLSGNALIEVIQGGNVLQTATRTQQEYADGKLVSLALEHQVQRGVDTTLRATVNGHVGTSGVRQLPTSGTCFRDFGTITTGNRDPTVSIRFASPSFSTADDMTALLGLSDPDGDALNPAALQWSRIRGGSEEVLVGQTSTVLAKEHFIAGDILKITVDVEDQFGGRTVTFCTIKVGAPLDVPIARLTIQEALERSPGLFKAARDRPITLDASASEDGTQEPRTPPENLAFAFDPENVLSDNQLIFGASPTFTYTPTLDTSQPRVVVRDENGFQGRTSAQLILNESPVLGSFQLVGPIRTTDDVTVNVAASDPDNADGNPDNDDVLKYRFQWYEADSDCLTGTVLLRERAFSTDASDTLSSALVPTKGRCLILVVTVSDGLNGDGGQSEILITNSPPQLVGAPTIGPSSPRTTDDLVAAAIPNDPDGDAVQCRFEWFRNGAGPIVMALGPCGAATLDHSLTAKGETWTVRVTPFDDQEEGSPQLSSPLTILNSAPSEPALLVPADLAKGLDPEPSILLQWAAATDADGDPIEYEVRLDTQKPPLFSLGTTAGTQHAATGLQPSTRYFWRVVAADDDGGTTESGIFTFHTFTTPSAPGPITSAEFPKVPDWAVVNAGTFTWQAATNPEVGSIVGYTVAVDAEPSTDPGDAQPGTSFTVVGPLAEGVHTFRVRAFNDEGRAGPSESYGFQIDAIPPGLTIDAPQPGETVGSTDVRVRFTILDGGSGAGPAECAMDAGPFGPCADGDILEFGAEASGEHAISVRAEDIAGNPSATKSVTFQIDTSAPSVQITSPGGGAILSSRLVIVAFTDATGSGGTPITKRECRIEAASFVECVSGDAFELDADGPHSLTVRVTNGAGTSATDAVSFQVDSAPPTLVITSPAPGDFLNTLSPTMIFQADGTGTAIQSRECRADSAAFGPCASDTSHGFTLAEGSHVLRVRVRDWAGHTTAAEIDVVLDVTAPTVTVTPGAPANAAGWHNAPISFTNTGADALTGATCDPLPTYSGPDTATGSVTGTCVDGAGNVGTRVFNFKLDRGAPSVAAGASPAPNAAGWYRSSVTVTFVGTDTLSGIASCSSPESYNGPDGAATLTGTCVDRAGNTGTASHSILFDRTSPTGVTGTPDRSPDQEGWYRSAVGVPFAGSDATSGIASCTSSSYSGPDSASAGVSGSCTDAAGNSASGSASFKYDATPPQVGLQAPNFVGASGGTLSVAITDSPSGVATQQVEVRRNGGPWQPLSGSGTSLPIPGSRSHKELFEFRAGATDQAGNVRALPAAPQATTRVDLQGPAAPTGVTVTPRLGGAFEVRWTPPPSDDGSPLASYNVYARGPGGSFQKAGSSTSPLFVADVKGATGQTYEFQVSAVDGVGNEGTRSAIASGVADATPPPAPRDVRVEGNQFGDIYTTRDLTVRWTGSADAHEYRVEANGAALGTTEATQLRVQVSADGEARLVVVALDRAGNEAPSTPVALLIDSTPPTARALAPAASAEPTFEVRFEASDATSGVASVLVYASTGGGPFVIAHSSTDSVGRFRFSSALNQQYGFAAVAVDRAGNAESAPDPAAPEATTRVQVDAEVPRPSTERTAPVDPAGVAIIAAGTTTLRVDVSGDTLDSLVVQFETPVPAETAIQVSEDVGAPAGVAVTALPSGLRLYAFQEVVLPLDVERLVAGAWFEYRVAKAWMTDQGAQPADIALYRLHESAWERLVTRPLAEEETAWRFESWTPGFSTFAIASVAPSEGRPLGEPGGPAAPWIALAGIVLFLALFAVGAIVVVARRSAARRRPLPTRQSDPPSSTAPPAATRTRILCGKCRLSFVVTLPEGQGETRLGCPRCGTALRVAVKTQRPAFRTVPTQPKATAAPPKA